MFSIWCNCIIPFIVTSILIVHNRLYSFYLLGWWLIFCGACIRSFGSTTFSRISSAWIRQVRSRWRQYFFVKLFNQSPIQNIFFGFPCRIFWTPSFPLNQVFSYKWIICVFDRPKNYFKSNKFREKRRFNYNLLTFPFS